MLTAIKAKTTKIMKAGRIGDCLFLETENGRIKIEPVAAHIIRIVYTLAEEFSQEAGPGMVPQEPWGDWQLEETETGINLRTARMQLHIDRETGQFIYYDDKGRRLTGEPKTRGKELVSFDSYRTILDETAVVDKIMTPDGIKEVVLDAKKEFDCKLYHTRLRFEWEPDEALYGMGQQEEGCLNLRGTRQYIHQANMKIAQPFLISTKGYGILMDTYSPLVFNDDACGSYIYAEASAELDYYVICGGNFDEIIGGYRRLTGQAAMLPMWAFGFMQSQERFESQTEILETVSRYRELGVPLDSIVLDWQSWDEGMWGQKSFDRSRFPEPLEMTDRLHDMGAHFMISIWPNMVSGCRDNLEMAQKGGLFQRSEIYNAFSPKARQLYWNQAREGLFSQGVDAWWCDSSEPFTPEWNNPVKPEPDQNMMAFHTTARMYMPERYTNAYPLFHARTMYEGQRMAGDEKRVVNLTRSGYTGIQKYGAILWSGDTCAKWSTLKKQIAAGLNYCASGLPYWTLDIGAFFVKQGHMWFWDGDYEGGCDDPGYRELYTRWYQMGAFLPVFRSHGTDCRREIWHFGEKGGMFYDAIERFTKLRYQLMPYIYSLAGQATQAHGTLLRLLAFDFLEDKSCYDIDDQFMFGPSMMVCPVTEPMYYHADGKQVEGIEKARSVYLPKGCSWYDFWTDQVYEGGQHILAESPIDKIPVFIRAGSILPMSEPIQHTGEMRYDRIRVKVYPGQDGKFVLYQDERDGYGYESGAYTLTELRWLEEAQQLVIGETRGCFENMPKSIEFQREIVGQ